MPSKFKVLVAVLFVIASFTIPAYSQGNASSAGTKTIPASSTSTTDVIRERVEKAKAYIAIKNFSAAIYELENIKRETSDSALDSVINVLLMNSYLEQNNYKQAESFLTKLAGEQKASQPNSTQNYFAVAAQVIRGAKTQLDRYHSLGLNVSDRNLPIAAASDVESMRNILELVVEQSKDLGKNPKNIDTAIALLEGATNARSNLAKDDYDANRWRLEVTDAREMLADSRSKVFDAVNPQEIETEQKTETIIKKPDMKTVAKNDKSEISLEPVARLDSSNIATAEKVVKKTINSENESKIDEKTEANVAKGDEKSSADEQKPTNRKRIIVGSNSNQDQTQAEDKGDANTAVADSSPIEVGSLTQYATKRTNPVYPSLARNMRMTGVVKVEVMVDEDGNVSEVQKTDGPSLLQRAAKDAIVKWQFKPFERDGQPVKAIGFVSFNFSL